MISALFPTASALAQDSPAVEACKAAGRHLTLNPDLEFPVVQDFSVLSPPHVRLGVPAEFGDTNVPLTCEFDAASPPMTLTAICHVFCLPPRAGNDMDALMAKSTPLGLDELNLLLDQDGY